MTEPNLSRFLWSVADLLRGDYRQPEYGKVILPFTVLRRLDCVLEAIKPAVLAELDRRAKAGTPPEPILLKKSGQAFYNTSTNNLAALTAEPNRLRKNPADYVQAFSPAVRDLFEKFGFRAQIDRLHRSRLLPQVIQRFTAIDLHPDTVSSAQMGSAFEELLRKFAESSSDLADHVSRSHPHALLVLHGQVLSPSRMRFARPTCSSGDWTSATSPWATP